MKCERLGDRHLENILLDTITGGVVHVDFNLLASLTSGQSQQVSFGSLVK